MLNYLNDSTHAIAWLERIASVGLILSGVEFLISPSQLSDRGLISWRVGMLRRSVITRNALDPFLRFPNILVLVACGTTASVTLLVWSDTIGRNVWVVLAVALPLGALFVRNTYGFDGADQLSWICFAALVPVCLLDTAGTRTLYLWFVGVQASLAYGVAGVAKATSRGWRRGEYLPGILGTATYGNARVASLLSHRATLARIQSNAVIVFECSFLVVLFLPLAIALALMAMAVGFHVVNAYVMGLNTFVWAFIATYPAIIFCIESRPW